MTQFSEITGEVEPLTPEVPEHRSISCGCCTCGACCRNHMDIPRGIKPSTCNHPRNVYTMKNTLVVLTLVAALFLVACGGSPSSTTPKVEPLDPQGNWAFTLQDQYTNWTFGGQLYELVPPIVTGDNGMGPNGNCYGIGNITMNGQATGTDGITLQLGAGLVSNNVTPPAYTLTGTIAADQEHMSGTWTATNQDGCTAQSTGTWTAHLIPAATGTWSSAGDVVTATLTENVNQESPDMGAIAGTVTVNNGCFTGPVTLDNKSSAHAGFIVVLAGQDAGGVSMTGAIYAGENTSGGLGIVSVVGGTCDGRSFEYTVSKN